MVKKNAAERTARCSITHERQPHPHRTSAGEAIVFGNEATKFELLKSKTKRETRMKSERKRSEEKRKLETKRKERRVEKAP